MISARCPSIILFLGVLFFVGDLRSEDWAQWRGPMRNGHVPDSWTVPDHLPAQPKVVWRIKTGESFASPVVSGGKVFYSDNVGGKETLHAVDGANAKELWNAAIDDVHQDTQGPPAPRCTPMVDGDRVYAQSCRGELQCLSVADGKLIWRVNYPKDLGAIFIGEKGNAPGAARHGNNASPIVDGEQLIACAGGTNGASVVCFDKRTGKVIWKSQNDQAGYAAPMIAPIAGVKQVVCFTVEGVLSVARDDGRFLWRTPVKTAYARHATTPVIYDDMVVVASHQAGLIGIKISRKDDTLNAEQVWVNKEAAMNFASPVAVGKYLYGLGPAKNIFCVEIPTGKLMWSKQGYIKTSADMAHAAFLVMGKNILISTDGGELVLITADPSECKEISRVQVCGLNWCNPAYADGKLYLREGVKSTGELLCLDLLK
ncbi:MAG: PQQ-like beta-propeller repeat protein [Verrucomicrobia bacterium]|nr:PQQ-like beta-propeller repeat protein [Verrucomicrobiota bacterium]